MMALEESKTPERQWNQAEAGDSVTAPDILLPSLEPHPGDSSSSIDSTAAQPDDVRGEQTLDVRLPSDSGDLSTDQDDDADEHFRAIEDWLARLCPAARKAEKGTSQAGTKASSSETLSRTGSIQLESDMECPDDQPPPSKPRACARESADSIRAMREVAVSSAHHAIARHSCQRLLHSARRALWLALLAVLASFVLQVASTVGPKITLALSLIALLGGVRWTILYLSLTARLSKHCAGSASTGK